MSRNYQGGPIARMKHSINEYIMVRKIRSKEIRDYFASEGESDPERLAAQRARDQEFLQSLKELGIGCIIFLIFYAIIRTILGLW
ncbi:hypothetical protein J5583_01190 [Streptococcus suis]|uniref:hypothetical protein n=1 Tax=Streptococcus suis TaxID=1307 RepID=UPI001ABDF0C2|nr:hypothetical protein [Streptococcus suis]MBO4108803.1 hypothetical protein [Streptococcus suis]